MELIGQIAASNSRTRLVARPRVSIQMFVVTKRVIMPVGDTESDAESRRSRHPETVRVHGDSSAVDVVGTSWCPTAILLDSHDLFQHGRSVTSVIIDISLFGVVAVGQGPSRLTLDA